METIDKKILQQALDQLQRTVNMNARIQYGKHELDTTFKIGFHEIELDFAVEIKNNIAAGTLGALVQGQKKLRQDQRRLIITQYASPPMADRMKELGIQFIDLAGNTYINDPPLFIFIKGNKPVEKYPVERPTRAFQPVGLKVVFAILCIPGLENEPFRKIAQKANAALGTVNWVINDLKNLGYIIDWGKKGRGLTRKKELLERWVTTYPDQLRPKNILGRYKSPDRDWWKNEELADYTAYWGGEIAAAKLTGYLKPYIATIYINGDPGRLLLKHKVTKELKGDIEIINAFWNFVPEWPYPNLVHPILIYADLIATGDARNIETAETIYEKEIARFIREN